MKNVEIVAHLQILRGLIKQSPKLSRVSLETQAHWARYLCILCAGLVENSVRIIYSDYAKRTASPNVRSFVIKTVSKIQNPKSGKLVEIAGTFDTAWGADLELFLSDNIRKEAVDSIMANRHLIAHGKNSGITVAKIEQYLMRIVEIVEFLEVQTA